MEVRAITQEEYLAYRLLCTVCFLGASEENYLDWHKDLEKHSEGYEKVLGCFDRQNNLVAGLGIAPYRMYFDGQVVDMGGIQGVVTAPEARGTGAAGKVLAESLRTMKENGQIFSVLYPFSYAYYRKFGYEVAHQLRKAEIPIEVFCRYPFPKDSIRFLKKGDDLADIKMVYDIFKKSRNYTTDRTDSCWLAFMETDPYTTKHYTYIHYNGQGIADSYLKYHTGDRVPGRGYDLYIDELAWTTEDGLLSMFGFIGGLRPQFDKVFWDVPMGVDLFSLFPEAYDISINTCPSAMTRIVDLPKVLETIRPSSFTTGKVVINIVDKSLPCNTGKYALSWENGVVHVKKSDQSPDMSTTIEAMTQIVIGYLTPAEAAYRQDTTIYNQQEALMALFPKKDLCLWEVF